MAETRDNVKVVLRVRPLNEIENTEGGRIKCIQSCSENNTVTITHKDSKSFNYDYVASEEISQEQIFQVVGRPIARSCLAGYNGTIFAYGQTGTGKTYTIMGTGTEEEYFQNSIHFEQRGILPRCFEQIFNAIDKGRTDDVEYLVKCTFLEIYQEQVIDLLDEAGSANLLQLRESINNGTYVEGAREEIVSNINEMYTILSIGARNRHVGCTSMNKESSRSHSVFTLFIECKEHREGLLNLRTSKFHLIDLAGSERQKSTDTTGHSLKEAGMINKSLSALGNVINSLVDITEGKTRHVHYRDSKLTFLLKDSLGGNSKTCIVANISPSKLNFGETLSTLQFAQRAKQIKNRAIINEDTSGTINILRSEVKRLRDELTRSESVCPICAGQGPAENVAAEPQHSQTTEFEMLLAENMTLRLNSERAYRTQVTSLEDQVQQLQSLVQKHEAKISNDKMVLKFRDATIQRLQSNTPDEEAEKAELREEIKALQSQVQSHPLAAKLFLENTQLKEENEQLRGEMSALPESTKARLDQSEAFTAQLQERLRIQAEEKQALKLQLEGQSVSEELQEYKTYMENLEKDINVEREQRDELQMSLLMKIEAAESRTQQLESQLETANAKLREYENEAHQKSLENSPRLAEIEELRSELDTERSKSSTVIAKRDNIQNELLDMQARYETLESKEKSLEATLASRDQLITQQKDQLANERGEKDRIICELNEQLEQFQNDLLSTQDALSGTEEIYAEKVSELEQVLSINAESGADRQHLLERIEQLQTQFDESQSKCEILKEASEAVDTEAKTIQKALENAESEYHQALENAETECQELRETTQSKALEIERLHSELESQAELAKQTEELMNTDIAELKSYVELQKQTEELFSADREQLERNILQLQTDLKNKDNEVSLYKHLQSTASTELRETVVDLKAQLEEKENDLKKQKEDYKWIQQELSCLNDVQQNLDTIKESARQTTDESELTIQDLKNQLSSKEDEIKSVHSNCIGQIAELNSQLEVYSEDKEAMLRHVQEAEEQVVELTNVLVAKDKELAREVDTQMQDKQAIVHKMQNAETKIKDLTEQLYEANEEKESVRGRIQEAQARVQKLTLQLEAKDSDKEAAVFTAAELETKVRKLTRLLESKDEQIAAAKEQADEAHQQNHLRLKDESQQNLIQVSSNLEAKLAKEQKRSQQLVDDLLSAKQCAERYQELSLNLTQTQADQSSELSRLKEELKIFKSSNSSNEKLQSEISFLRDENSSLRDESRQRLELLQNTSSNINNTKTEVGMWKKCIDEKNQLIQELKYELRKKDDSGKLEEAQSEIHYLTCVLQMKEKETHEIAEKGQVYMAEAEEALATQQGRSEEFEQRCRQMNAELVKTKEDLRISVQHREAMVDEIKRLRAEDLRSYKENEDFKSIITHIKEEKARLLLDMEILNKENDRLASQCNIGQKVKLHAKMKEKTKSLKTQNKQLTEELVTIKEHMEILQSKCNQRQSMPSSFMGDPHLEELKLRKQVKRANEQISSLHANAAKIADFVFRLPAVNHNPEETIDTETTIRAIASLYERLESRERELRVQEKELSAKNMKLQILDNDTGRRQVKETDSRKYKTPVAHYQALLTASNRGGSRSRRVSPNGPSEY